ncbi:MAG: hypothetical protein EPO28_15050 [Saprospiraceae bacterium]|nr:MAG: hypothetical protein EPO28_15050 [Saprospiraceae bacterium]
MRTILFSFIATLFILNTVNAQSKQLMGKGNTDFTLGIGIMSSSAFLEDARTILPPLTLHVHRHIGQNFSLGLSYSQSSYQSQPVIVSDGLAQKVTNRSQQLGLKGAFHYNQLEHLDFYGGFLLAVNNSKFSVNYGNFDYLETHMNIHPEADKVTYTGFVGAEYVFSNRVLAFSEVGFGSSIFTFGVGYRL